MEKYKSFVYKALYLGLVALFGYLFIKLSAELLLPFALALVVTLIIYPVSRRINKKLKIKEPVSVFLIILVSILAVVGLFIFVFIIVTKELGGVVARLLEALNNGDSVLDALLSLTRLIEEKLPFLKDVLKSEEIYSALAGALTDILKSLSQKITAWAGSVIKNLPQLFVAFVSFALSLFYLVKDYKKISTAIFSILPKKCGEVAVILKNETSQMLIKYIKSYGLILIITFAELFSGFLVLGIENSFAVAMIISLVDILPIVGSGIVLIPWGVTMLIFGNAFQGVGVIVIAIIVYIVRQLVEPRIISSQMNMHPLLTLISMYVGLKIQGAVGMIFAPFFAFFVKTIYTTIKNEKNVEMLKKL